MKIYCNLSDSGKIFIFFETLLMQKKKTETLNSRRESNISAKLLVRFGGLRGAVRRVVGAYRDLMAASMDLHAP